MFTFDHPQTPILAFFTVLVGSPAVLLFVLFGVFVRRHGFGSLRSMAVELFFLAFSTCTTLFFAVRLWKSVTGQEVPNSLF
jgi:hypothetical protein